MKIRIFSTAQALGRALAAEVARALRRNPRLVLGLPAGRTPIPFYRELTAISRDEQLDFSQASTFNLDEFAGLMPDDPRSYRSFMDRYLFAHVNLRRARIHVPDGAAPDLDRECRRYERAIQRAGGIDLQIVGLGTNGHIGFNEPGPSLVARAHPARLTAATRRANAALFDDRLVDVPRTGLSMGIATILSARRVVLVATGTAKARGVMRLVNGPITTRLPASFLQLHAAAEVWVDRAAASRLRAAP